MKVRTGFVSNSSTSSFLVALDRIPHSSQEMKEIIFRDQDFIRPNWQDEIDSPTATIEIAKLLYLDTVNSPFPPSYDEAIYFFTQKIKIRENRFLIEIQTPNGIEKKYNYEKANEYKRKKALPLLKKFIEDNKDKFIYMFVQGSDYGFVSSLIETEDIFKGFNHVCLNEH